MKSHLMFRNRDFNLETELPINHEELVKDLELDTLFKVMASDDQFLYGVAKQAMLSRLGNIDEVQYRQDVLRDCLKNRDVVRQIYHLAILSKQNKRERRLGIFSHYPRGILSSAVKLMGMFSELFTQLKKITDENAESFSSEGFRSFFTMVENELNDEYLAEIDQYLKVLEFKSGVLASMKLGKGNEVKDHTLRLPEKGSASWIKMIFGKITKTTPEYSFVIPSSDDHGARALSDIVDRSVNEAANALAQSANHVENFFNNLHIELSFYLGCLNLAETLEKMTSPFTFPVVHPATKKMLHFHEMYDISLALTMEEKVVSNTLKLSDKDLVIITGANQGGKSTFLRSVGIAQVMLESGMFVPANAYSANMSNGIFTHYRRKEDSSMKSGKLDEELERMSRIVDHLSPKAMVLFNESFSATNEREGAEIARQITKALVECQVRVFFVTHMYKFAQDYYEENQQDILFLRAEREPDGTRSFRLIEGKPLRTSFGNDIFLQVFHD